MLHRSLDQVDPTVVRVAVEGGELRADAENRMITGHAAVFDQETELWPGYREVIRPGAFTKTLRDGADVRALFNHDPTYLLGRTKAGTLRLREDGQGLHYEVDAPQTQTIRDLVLEPLRRGDLSGSSFAFRAVKAPETADEDGNVLREIVEAKLIDVSPVTFPAYDGTDAGLRAARQLRAAQALGHRTPVVTRAILEACGLTEQELRAMMTTSKEGEGHEPSGERLPSLRDLELRLELLKRTRRAA